jgi:signal transduction histidine kinase
MKGALFSFGRLATWPVSGNVSFPRSTIPVFLLGQEPQFALRDDFRITYLNTDLFITAIVIVAGILIGMLILTHLRTRQKRDAEAFLQSILDTTLYGIISFQAIRDKGKIVDFNITFVNRAILKFLRLSENEIRNRTVLQINPLVKDEGIFDRYIQVVESGKPMKFQRNLGDEHFQVLLAKFHDGLVASFYNITELNEAEQKLRTKIQELENINVEFEQFAYVTSHDLQEPLRKINMFADLMMKACQDPDTHFHLASIVRSAGRMRKLIVKLSEYSRLKNTNALFQKVDLNEIIKDLVLIYDDLMLRCNMTVEYSRLPVVEGIPLQLYTVFDNLINNAIKFAKIDGTSRIMITVRSPDEQEVKTNDHLNHRLPYVEVIFKDNGVGFEQQYARQIFGIFQQLERSPGTEDVGMGLALCLKIVRGHQGDIYAVSTVNEGSEFHILLPVQQVANPVSEPT